MCFYTVRSLLRNSDISNKITICVNEITQCYGFIHMYTAIVQFYNQETVKSHDATSSYSNNMVIHFTRQ